MAITKTQSITGNGATLTLNTVVSTALLTLQSSTYQNGGAGAAETTPTDTQGTWSVGRSDTPGVWSATQFVTGAIFYQKNVASGTHTVTPQVRSSPRRTLAEWAGADTTAPLDQTASGTTSGSAHTSRTTGTTGTTTQADEMVLIVCGVGAGTGANPMGNAGTTFGDSVVSGFTDLQTVNNDSTDIGTQHEWNTVAATGTQSATFTWTASESTMTSQAAICTFKAAAAAGGTGWGAPFIAGKRNHLVRVA